VAAPDQTASTVAPGRHAARNQRHAYLIGRLNNRQLTMEEATELFAIMQEMLAASEAARLALLRTPPSARAGVSPQVPAVPRPPSAPSGGDDLLLVGLLAMGAGAGLLAAMTKRIQDVTTPAGSTTNSRSSSGSSSG